MFAPTLANDARYTHLRRLEENPGCRSAFVCGQGLQELAVALIGSPPNKCVPARPDPEAHEAHDPEAHNAVSPTSGLLHKALLDKGYIKATNFKNNQNKRGYLYQLTPAGITAKAKTAKRFLVRKQLEYERLEAEIKQLRCEADAAERGQAYE